jgi:hypothetical protein
LQQLRLRSRDERVRNQGRFDLSKFNGGQGSFSTLYSSNAPRFDRDFNMRTSIGS